MTFCAKEFGWTVWEFNRTPLDDILTMYDIIVESQKDKKEEEIKENLQKLKILKEKGIKGG